MRKGLDATNARIMNCADNQDMIFDEHGMLFRKYDPLIDEYSPEQMKIVNSTLAITIVLRGRLIVVAFLY